LSSVELWDAIWKKTSHHLDENDPIFCVLDQAVKHVNARSIIELGSGSGVRTLLLASRYNIKVTLVDFSSEAIKLSKYIATQLLQLDNNRVRYIQQDIFSDKFFRSFEQESFDIVWSGGLNEHFAGVKRQKIFDIMASLCKEEGKVIVIVPNKASMLYWGLRIYSKMRGTWEVGYEDPFLPKELILRMTASGLRRVKVKGLDWQLSGFFQKHFKISREPIRKILENSFQSDLLYGEGTK